MSEERKARVAKRKAERERKNAVSPEVKPLGGTTNNTIDSAAIVDEQFQNNPAEELTLESKGDVTEQNDALPKVAPIVGKAEVQNPSMPDIKPPTFSDMLAPQRRNIVKDKTDAAKMQKYYALTDALGALGKMGGAAIGGAIGGNMLDSAPNVGEYKESRGYLDALERAKQANDRLRALDEKQYQLALRDEERTYQQQMAKINRDFQIKLEDYRSQLRAAEAEKNHEREKEIRQLIADLQMDHDTKIQTLRGEYDLKEKQIGYDTVKLQMGGKKKEEESPITYTFHDMTKADIPRHLYSDMISWALSKGQIGEDYVDEDNVELVLRKHPEIVNSYLNVHGLGTKPEEKPVEEVVVEKENPVQNVRPVTTGGAVAPAFTYTPKNKKEEKTESNVNSDIEPSSDVKKKWASKKTE